MKREKILAQLRHFTSYFSVYSVFFVVIFRVSALLQPSAFSLQSSVFRLFIGFFVFFVVISRVSATFRFPLPASRF